MAERHGRRTLSDEAEEYLKEIRLDLTRSFPGFNKIDGIGKKPSVISVIDGGAVEKALNDPVLMETETGQALEIYWENRQKVIDLHERVGIESGWRQGKDSAPLRQWLRGVGDDLVDEYPNFGRMWDDFLSREFEEDED